MVQAEPYVVPEPAGFGSQIKVFKPSFWAQRAVDMPTMPAPTTIKSKSLSDIFFLTLVHPVFRFLENLNWFLMSFQLDCRQRFGQQVYPSKMIRSMADVSIQRPHSFVNAKGIFLMWTIAMREKKPHRARFFICSTLFYLR